MKTYVHLWDCPAEFLLEWETFQTKVVDKIKTHILCSITFFEKRAGNERVLKKTSQQTACLHYKDLLLMTSVK
jgi:hypothetical protein